MRSPRPRAAHARLSRRRFLAASAAAAAGAAALPACADSGRAEVSGRVVVVGAGLAGLIAAYELERAGLEVVLLEASDRAGGRLLTERTAFFADQSAELGGEYIDRSHRVMLRYVRRLGLDLDDLRDLGRNLSSVVYEGGKTTRYDEAVGPEVEAETARFRARVEELAAPLDPRDPAGAGAALDRRSVADLIEELDLEDDARRIVEREIRDEYTVEPDRLSLLFHASLTKLYARAPRSGTEAYRIDGGNERLLGALIDEIEAKVDRDAPVTAVDARADGVTVSVDGSREVDADFCIVTAPLPLVREIEFRPRLSGAVAAAAAELQYGAVTKTALQYRRRAWAERGLDGDALTDLPIGSLYEATNAQTGRPGILISYASGEEGRRLGDVPDSERITLAAAAAERVFPAVREKLEAGATAAWAQDRWARGSYAAYAPGQVVRFWRALRRPAGRVHLAGEHCDAYTGYMEGAVRSGRRVAREIVKRAGGGG